MRTTLSHPQCDSFVECLNCTLISILIKYCSNSPNNWDLWLSPLLGAYRSAKQASTGCSLFELVYGRFHQLPADSCFDTSQTPPADPRSFMTGLQNRRILAREIVEAHLVAAQEAQRRNYNARPSHRHTTGDKLYLFTPPTGRNQKLTCPWTSPFEIITRRGENGYMIQPIRGRRKVVHYNRLKPCYQRASNEISETVKSPDAPNNNQEDPPAQTRLEAIPPPLHTETTLEQGRSYSKETKQPADVEMTSKPTQTPPLEISPSPPLDEFEHHTPCNVRQARTDRLKTPWT